MSINATFYNLDKRKNSTKIPTGAGNVVAVDLKAGVDILNPSFLIAQAAMPTWNYLLFEGRYYFIIDITSVRTGLWEVVASVDTLATYKSNILGTSAHVLYYDHSNNEISDARLSTKTTKTIQTNSAVFDTLGSGGTANNVVVVSVVGKDSCASYAVNQDTARGLLSNLDNWYDDDVVMPEIPENPFTEIVDAFTYFTKQCWFAVKQLLATGKASDSIKNAIMLPLPVSAIGGSEEEIYLGKYETDKNGTRVTDRVFSDGCDIAIPWQATDWRRNAPYTELFLFIPYVGLITLSTSDLIGEDSLHVSVNIDVTSGDTIFTVYSGSLNHVLGQYTTNLASAFAIGSSNITPAQGATIIGSGIAAIASGGSSVAIGAAALGMMNVINGQPMTIGSNTGGAALGLNSQVKCYTIFHDTTVSPSSVSEIIGTPYNGVLSLSNITGYIQTKDFSVAGTMTSSEKDLINDLMDGGVYIE